MGDATVLGLGTSVAGDVTLDSIATQAVVRNLNGTLAIGGKLEFYDDTAVLPATFPEPGQSTLTIMTYTSKTGDGTLVFDPAGYRGSPSLQVGPTAAVISGLDVQTRTWTGSATGNWSLTEDANWAGGDGYFKQGDTVVFPSAGAGPVTLSGVVTPAS